MKNQILESEEVVTIINTIGKIERRFTIAMVVILTAVLWYVTLL